MPSSNPTVHTAQELFDKIKDFFAHPVKNRKRHNAVRLSSKLGAVPATAGSVFYKYEALGLAALSEIKALSPIASATLQDILLTGDYAPTYTNTLVPGRPNLSRAIYYTTADYAALLGSVADSQTYWPFYEIPAGPGSTPGQYQLRYIYQSAAAECVDLPKTRAFFSYMVQALVNQTVGKFGGDNQSIAVNAAGTDLVAQTTDGQNLAVNLPISVFQKPLDSNNATVSLAGEAQGAPAFVSPINFDSEFNVSIQAGPTAGVVAVYFAYDMANPFIITVTP